MFQDQTLPTLDTKIWMDNGQVRHMFYEKPTVGNRVLCKETALPTSSLRASLLQETVRRLQNCSPELDLETKQRILSEYGVKLINSGHSVKSARILLVQGVVKFLWRKELNDKPREDPDYVPLYVDKEYQEENRQILKYQAKMMWFNNKKKKDCDGERGSSTDNGWRRRLHGIWRGSSMSQKQVLKSGFSSVLNVPNTQGAALARKLIRCETKLAKITGYNIKIVEKSGVQLCKLFQRIYTPAKCHVNECPVCEFNNDKGGCRCRMSIVVY